MEASETEVLKEGKINREKENLGFPKTSSTGSKGQLQAHVSNENNNDMIKATCRGGRVH